tara:strand:- start:1185 stop:1412 length:228 start_codon:yes stop_codon:yes gene_type:complete
MLYNEHIINHKRRLKMGTRNKMIFNELLYKYKKSGQIIIEDGKLIVLEKNKDKADEIIWELATYSPQFALQMFKS